MNLYNNKKALLSLALFTLAAWNLLKFNWKTWLVPMVQKKKYWWLNERDLQFTIEHIEWIKENF